MRLIDTTTFQFKEFFPIPPPSEPYYILSHTWASDGAEPSYQAFLARGFREVDVYREPDPILRLGLSPNEGIPDDGGPGFDKILNFCRMARRNDVRWAWVDTVCIDKTSSAELSEAINSMYSYYEGAAVCCVFLSDVSSWDGDEDEDEEDEENEQEVEEEEGEGDGSDVGGVDVVGNGTEDTASRDGGYVDSNRGYSSSDSSDRPVSLPPKFRESRWFGRGWTLQELVAPSAVEFYDRRWRYIGTKRGMSRAISSVTGIDEQVLTARRPARLLPSYSIGTRMSWAAGRQVTRVEDAAYSLLGIFGINMYLLYGEREDAFQRLQRKLLKGTDDETLFAWSMPVLGPEPGPHGDARGHPARHPPRQQGPSFSGMLAPGPAAFAHARSVRPAGMDALPLSISNKGIRVPVFNVAYAHMDNASMVLPLNCVAVSAPPSSSSSEEVRSGDDDGDGDGGEVVGVILANFHGRWYRRANAGLVRIGMRLSPATLFAREHRPGESMLVEMAAPVSVRGVVSPLPVDAHLPTALRFPNHFPDPVALLLSLDPWELDRLAAAWDDDALIASATRRGWVMNHGLPCAHLAISDASARLLFRLLEFSRLLRRRVVQSRWAAALKQEEDAATPQTDTATEEAAMEAEGGLAVEERDIFPEEQQLFPLDMNAFSPAFRQSLAARFQALRRDIPELRDAFPVHAHVLGSNSQPPGVFVAIPPPRSQ